MMIIICGGSGSIYIAWLIIMRTRRTRSVISNTCAAKNCSYHSQIVSMSIDCVAIIGDSNCPLYLATYPKLDSADLQHRFQLIVYSSLDIIDAWVKNRKSGNVDNNNGDNQFVGYLCSIEHFKIFGYVTNTSLKFLVVVKDEVDSLRIPFEQVRNFFVSLHDLYIEALYNPFYKIGMPLTSDRFAKKTNSLVSQSEKAWFQ